MTPTPRARLLVVDDEPNTLASLSRAFRLAGHEAVVCDSAQKALQMAVAESRRARTRFSTVICSGNNGFFSSCASRRASSRHAATRSACTMRSR